MMCWCYLAVLLWCTLGANSLARTAPPIGEVVIAFDYGGDIYVTDFHAHPANLTQSEAFEHIPVWSPDGTTIAFASADSNVMRFQLHVLALATGEIRQLNEVEVSIENRWAWSSDGRSLAGVTADGRLFVVDVSSGEVKFLPVDCGLCNPAWLSDSTGLIATSSGDIYLMQHDWQLAQPLSPTPAYRAAASPVANDIAFVTYQNELFTTTIGNENLNLLLTLPQTSTVEALYWSPDGEYIAVGTRSVYVIQRDGTVLWSETNQDSLLLGWTNDSQHLLVYEVYDVGATGAYFKINILNGQRSRISSNALENLCTYLSCHHVHIQP